MNVKQIIRFFLGLNKLLYEKRDTILSLSDILISVFCRDILVYLTGSVIYIFLSHFIDADLHISVAPDDAKEASGHDTVSKNTLSLFLLHQILLLLLPSNCNNTGIYKYVYVLTSIQVRILILGKHGIFHK